MYEEGSLAQMFYFIKAFISSRMETDGKDFKIGHEKGKEPMV